MIVQSIQLTSLFVGIALISAVLVGLVYRFALAWQILDIPNDRSSHDSPTPRGGGLVIVGISLAGLLAYILWSGAHPAMPVYSFIMAAAMIALVSWLDDIRSLPNWVRFVVHLAGALIVILGSGAAWQSFSLPFYGELPLGIVGFTVALMWIAGFTNSYNFMDGIDGIAGVQAVVAGLGWLLLGSMINQPECAVLGMLISAGSAGFLWWNLPPAKIFMGDVGSAFIGFSFAFMSVWAAANDPHMAVAGVILVWPFVFDSIFTLLRRVRKGENIFKPHRSHLYQRLVQQGWTHGQVSILYMLLALVGIVPATTFVRCPTLGSWLIITILPLFAAGLWIFVICHEKKHATSEFNTTAQSISYPDSK
jgi:Fuc2NAc and GlcNAc transferase